MKNDSNTDVKNTAKRYRDVLRFNVIPLKAGSKVAALQKNHPYLYRRATDEEFENFDFRNVGIVTGEVSGIIVLDEDKRGALEAQGWKVPVTARRRPPKATITTSSTQDSGSETAPAKALWLPAWN